MKSVPIQDLKQNLSALVAEAEAGERILVTRHGRPVAMLTPPGHEHLVVGSRAKGASLKPLFRQPATKGLYLKVLDLDRRERDGR